MKKLGLKGVKLNTGLVYVVRWIAPEPYFSVQAGTTVDIPLVTKEWNLPKATVSLLLGTLPDGLAIQDGKIVGTIPDDAPMGVTSFTLRASSTLHGKQYHADRTFHLVTITGDYDFRWVTPEGLIDADVEGTPTTVQFVAQDPLGLPISYTRVGGPLPTGLKLDNTTGKLEGNYPLIDGDRDFTFVIEAYNGFRRITREFTISVWDAPSKDAPDWVTPKGPLANLYEGMVIDELLQAVPTTETSEDIIYMIKGGSPPAGASFEANGVVYGLLDEVEDDTLFRIVIGASADNGNTFNKRLFEILVRQNWPPEWPVTGDVLFSEVEGYELEDVKFEATDRNSPDQSITYYVTEGSNLPPGVTFDPYTGILSGVAPAHKGGVEPDEYTFTIRAHDSLKYSDKELTAFVQKNLPPTFSNGGGNSVVEYFGLNGDYLETAANTAVDPNNKPLIYSITGGSIPQGWDFNPSTGVVSGILPLTDEEDIVFDFVLTASDNKFNTNQNVRITSWMNTPPVWKTTTLKNGLEGKPYEGQLVAVDRELKPVTYRYLGGDLPPGLTVESTGRVVGFMPSLPDDNNKTITLIIEADDGVLQSIGTVTLENQKNLPPYWVSEGLLFEIPGQKPISFTLEWVEPNDQPVYFEVLDFKRSDQKGREPHNDIERWNFDKRSGTMSGIMPHTFEGDVTYSMTIAVLDGDHPYELYPDTVRTFTFVRKQNLYPVWITEKNLLALPEGSDVHAVIEGYDPEGEEVEYYRYSGAIYNGYSNDPRSGGSLSITHDTVTGKLPANVDKDRHFDFSVSLDDNTRGNPFYYRTPRTFRITALYNKPPRFLSPELLFKRVEDTNYTYQVRATNLGNAETMKIALTSGTLPPGLTMTPDGLISGRLPLIDGPSDVEYVFELTADNTTKTTTQTFRIINEKNISPYWETDAGSVGAYYANNELGIELKAIDPNEKRGNPLRFSSTGLPVGASVNPVTGALVGVLPILLNETTYTFDVTVTDGMYSATRTFSITQKANEAPVFVSDGTVASPYDSEEISARVVAKDAENEELTYSLVDGSSLPGDLVLNPDGTITGDTGSVEVDVDYPFEVQVSDSFFDVRKVLNLRVIKNLPPVWITPPGRLASLIAGNGFSTTLEAFDPNEQDLTFHLVGGVPPLNFNIEAESGILTFGTLKSDPSKIYNLLIGVTDGRFMVVQQFSFEVKENNAPEFVTIAGRLFSAHVNEDVSFALIAQDDHDELEFSLSGGFLPPGLTLEANGVITGTTGYEEPSEYVFGVQITDGHWEVFRTFSIELLNDEPVWVTDYFMGKVDEYSLVDVQLEAYDPEGSEITYEMEEHPTLTLTPEGRLTGTIPSVLEDGFVTANAVAFDGFMSTPRSFTWDVNFISPPVWITDSEALPEGTEQYPYAARLVAKANNQNIIYTVVSGDFPNTLTLDPDGTIHGALPLVTGDTVFEFEVEALAEDGKRSSAIFRLRVLENLAPVWETPIDLEDMPYDTKGYRLNFIANDANDTPLTYTLLGGTPPFNIDFGNTNSYALMEGDLPALTEDTKWTFTIGADDGFIRTERTFNIKGLENKAPVWMTPAGLIGTYNEDTFIDAFVTARDEKENIEYTLLSDDFPVNENGSKAISVSGNRIGGRVRNAFGNETYTFVMQASDGEKSSTREFKIAIKNNDRLYDAFSNSVAFFARADDTTVFDTVNRGLQPTFVGDAVRSSGQTRFGTRSFFGSFGSTPSYIEFDGGDERAPFQLDSAITPEWTWEMWLYQSTTGGTQHAMFIGDPNDLDPNKPKVGISVISGAVTFISTTGNGVHSFPFFIGEIPTETWSHVAVGRDKNGTLHGFINGKRVASRPKSVLLNTEDDGDIVVRIAGSTNGQNNWHGYIDEVRMTHAFKYEADFKVSQRMPVPPRFISTDGMLVAAGNELQEPNNVLALSGETLDQDAIQEARFHSYDPHYEVSKDGKLVFEKFPVANDVTSDHSVRVSVLDSNGNLSWPNSVRVRSTAAFSTNLLAQWRYSASKNTTLSVLPVTITATGDDIAVSSDGAPGLFLTQPLNMSTSAVSQMNTDFTMEFWIEPKDLTNGALLSVASLPVISLADGKLSAGGITGGSVTAGVWNHVALERKASKMTLYLNGKAVGQTTLAPSSVTGGTIALNGRAAEAYYRGLTLWKMARYNGDFGAEFPGYGEGDAAKWLTESDLGTFYTDDDVSVTLNYRDVNNTVTSVDVVATDLPRGLSFSKIDMTLSGGVLTTGASTHAFKVTLNTPTGPVVGDFTFSIAVRPTGVEWVTDPNLGEFDKGAGVYFDLTAISHNK